jgi:hypothetical protein
MGPGDRDFGVVALAHHTAGGEPEPHPVFVLAESPHPQIPVQSAVVLAVVDLDESVSER